MNSYSEIGIIIINFLRPEITKRCILSLIEYAPGIQIYLGDQDKESKLKDWTKQYENIYFTQLPFDCGISISRNKLVQKIQKDKLKYVMWADNDFEFHKDSNILHAKEILDNNKDIGVVGGSLLSNNKIQHYERLFWHDKERGVLMLLPLEYTYPETYTINNINYFYCDLVFNFCLAKINVFKHKKIRWINKIKIKFEHSAWFIRLKEYSNWKVVYCPSFNAIHHHMRNTDYSLFRNRNNDFKIFSKEFNLKVNMCFGEVCWDFITEKIAKPEDLRKNSPTFQYNLSKKETLPDIEPISIDNNIIELTTEPSIEEPIINQEYQENNLLEKIIKQEESKIEIKQDINLLKTHIEVLKLFIEIIEKYNINYTLIERTCLEYITNKLFTNPLNLAIALSEEAVNELKENNFQFLTNQNIKYNDIEIFISSKGHNNWKYFNPINGKSYKVPFPVVVYLKNLYGRNWEKK